MNPRFKCLTAFALACFALLCANLHAATELEQSFDAANKLYEQGKYSDAAAAYEKLIQSGPVSTAIFYNLGNALFKSGQMGRAIAAYRDAGRLSPRDPDVQANLQFARNQIPGESSVRATFAQRWLGKMTVNEWTLLTATAVWLWFGLLAAVQWKPAWNRSLRNYTAGFGLAAALLAVCTGATLRDNYMTKSAVVISREAVARTGPLEEAQSAFTVRDGTELNILDQKDDWLLISDGGRRSGWLRRDAVLLLEPAPSRKLRT